MLVKGKMVALCLLVVSVLSLNCAGGDGTSVSVLDNAFAPRTLTVPVGTVVVWNWNGQVAHDVVFQPASGIASSQIQNTPSSFQARFDTPGTFPYLCSLHSGMTGTIIVR